MTTDRPVGGFFNLPHKRSVLVTLPNNKAATMILSLLRGIYGKDRTSHLRIFSTDVKVQLSSKEEVNTIFNLLKLFSEKLKIKMTVYYIMDGPGGFFIDNGKISQFTIDKECDRQNIRNYIVDTVATGYSDLRHGFNNLVQRHITEVLKFMNIRFLDPDERRFW